MVLRAHSGAGGPRGGARAVQPRLLQLDAARLLPGGPVRAARGAPGGRRAPPAGGAVQGEGQLSLCPHSRRWSGSESPRSIYTRFY